MPLFLFPALGVLSSKEVSVNYMKDTNFLFIGGLIIAVAVEEANLHQRIALSVLVMVGSKPKWLMLGFMSVTWFLSMWISNTATTAMMVPIVEAVLAELIKHGRQSEGLLDSAAPHQHSLTHSDTTEEAPETQVQDLRDVLKPDRLSVKEMKLCKCLLLAVAYAANIGGTGTLTGTPPNIVMAGLLEGLYGTDTGVSFATWMGFAIPGALLNLVLAWLWLQLVFLGWRVTLCKSVVTNDENVEQILKQKHKDLGRISWAEGSVLVMFLMLVLLWLFRAPGGIPGWGSLFKPSSESPKIRKPLLNWGEMSQRFPWGVVILLGGGFALGDAVKKSGLSELIGGSLGSLSGLGPLGLCLVSIIIMTFVTEITSNTATASIFIPILCAVAEQLQINPLYFVLAITVCASYAFMLPVATPPNAIVFSSGLLRVVDMMVVGFTMNWIGIFVMFLSINTWTYCMFNLGEYPSWAPNATTTMVTPLFNISLV